MAYLNPFDQEEVIQAWLEIDQDYQNAKRQSLEFFLQQISRKKTERTFINHKQVTYSWIMAIQDSYIKIVNFVTKNAVIATIIMILALTTLSASAAEVFAPEEFKPSRQVQNLFSSNKQVDKDPYTPLKPDQENDVISLDACDISIKFPKSLKVDGEDLPITPSYMENKSSVLLGGLTLVAPEKLLDPNNPYSVISQIHYFTIGCYGKNYIPGPRDQVNFSTEAMSKQELLDKFGWFITQADITDIKQMKFDDNIEMGTNYRGYNQINFKYKDKLYFIHFQERNGKPEEYTTKAPQEDSLVTMMQENGVFNRPGLFGNQIQLQFNSLVKNQANREIEHKPNKEDSFSNLRESSSSSLSQSSSSKNPDYEEFIFEACNLKIGFPKFLKDKETFVFQEKLSEEEKKHMALNGFKEYQYKIDSVSILAKNLEQIHNFAVKCYDGQQNIEEIKDLSKKEEFTSKDIPSTKRELQYLYAWSIAESDITNISVVQLEIQDLVQHNLFFKYENKIYQMIYYPKLANEKINPDYHIDPRNVRLEFISSAQTNNSQRPKNEQDLSQNSQQSAKSSNASTSNNNSSQSSNQNLNNQNPKVIFQGVDLRDEWAPCQPEFFDPKTAKFRLERLENYNDLTPEQVYIFTERTKDGRTVDYTFQKNGWIKENEDKIELPRPWDVEVYKFGCISTNTISSILDITNNGVRKYLFTHVLDYGFIRDRKKLYLSNLVKNGQKWQHKLRVIDLETGREFDLKPYCGDNHAVLLEGRLVTNSSGKENTWSDVTICVWDIATERLKNYTVKVFWKNYHLPQVSFASSRRDPNKIIVHYMLPGEDPNYEVKSYEIDVVNDIVKPVD